MVSSRLLQTIPLAAPSFWGKGNYRARREEEPCRQPPTQYPVSPLENSQKARRNPRISTMRGMGRRSELLA